MCRTSWHQPPDDANGSSAEPSDHASPEKIEDGKRTIAAWELLATVLANKAFSEQSTGERRAIAVSRGMTDNQGNTYLLNKMMSTPSH